MKTSEGGDNSVQRYGTESSPAERTDAAIALQAYLNARREGKWSKMCAQLAASDRNRIARASGQSEDLAGCAAAIGKVVPKLPRQILHVGARIEKVLSFRSAGTQGFLLFLGPPEHTLYSVPMSLEGGEWKVDTFVPIALPL